MYKFVALSIIVGTALFLCGTAMAATAPWPTKVYDALYERTGGHGTGTFRELSDGKGHVRIENKAGDTSYKSVVICDYPKKAMYVLLDQQKKVMKSALAQEQVYASDEAQIKALGGKVLGSKMIGGHPCHGWEVLSNGVKKEIWTGDDIGCPVLTVTEGPDGKEEQHLIKFSAEAPAADLFEIPRGYEFLSQKF